MARNVTNVVQGYYAYCENLNKLIRELIAALTIAIIISFLNLKISLTLIFLFIVVSYLYFTYLRPKIKTKAKQNQDIVSNPSRRGRCALDLRRIRIACYRGYGLWCSVGVD